MKLTKDDKRFQILTSFFLLRPQEVKALQKLKPQLHSFNELMDKHMANLNAAKILFCFWDNFNRFYCYYFKRSFSK